MIVAQCRRSSRSSEISTTPSTVTNEKGGASSSTHNAARGSRRNVLPFNDSSNVVNRSEPSSTANQMGATWGRPSSRVVASLPVCGGSAARNAHTSASAIGWCGTRSAGGDGEVDGWRGGETERLVRPPGVVAVVLEQVLHEVLRPGLERRPVGL